MVRIRLRSAPKDIKKSLCKEKRVKGTLISEDPGHFMDFSMTHMQSVIVLFQKKWSSLDFDNIIFLKSLWLLLF